MQCLVDGCDFESSEHGVKCHSGQAHSVEENPYRVKCECNYCGDEFTVWKSEYERGGGKYCSKECKGLHKTEKKTVECECNCCGDEFRVQKYEYENKRVGKYCSEKCQGLHKTEKGTVECECNYCGDEFTVWKSQYERGQGKYCSMECRSEHNTVECKCDHCGDEIIVIKSKYEKFGKNYCSSECMGLDYSKKNYVQCECNYCGDEFTVTKSSAHTGKYCSHKCHGLDNRSANPDIRDSPEYKQFRQTVLERDNHRCVECGDDDDLHVHHVIPIYDDESLATDVDNGKTLCVECHAEAHEELGDPHLAALIRSDGTKFEISVSV